MNSEMAASSPMTATTAAAKEESIAGLVQRLTLPQNVSSASMESVTVDLADTCASITFPVSMFADSVLSDAVVLASTLELGSGAVLAQGPQQTSEGATRELVSALNINILGPGGSPVSVADLAVPIRFASRCPTPAAAAFSARGWTRTAARGAPIIAKALRPVPPTLAFFNINKNCHQQDWTLLI